MSYVIKLKNANRSMTVKHITRNVVLRHVGRMGLTGRGVPTGGITGQTLIKASNTDYDMEWSSAGAGDMLTTVYDPQTIEDDAFDRANHTGTQAVATISDFDAEVSNNTDVAANTTARHTHANKAVLDATTASFLTADESKLDGIATGATANDTDANLKARANHTGTQTASTISDFNTAADARITAQKGQNSGLAELDSGGKVPAAQLPSYVDDVLEVASFSALPGTGATGVIYITQDDNKTYRWTGSAYAEISASLALGETSATAYRGDRGKAAYDHSLLTSGNPHAVTKSEVGLGNADNTSDANKPVSTAQATADALVASNAASALASHEADTTSVHGITNTASLETTTGAQAKADAKVTQNITNGVTTTAPSEDAVFDALALKAPLASPTFTGTFTLPTGLTGVVRADAGVVSTDSDVTDIVAAASTSAAGKVELATTAETDTGTDTVRAVTPDGLSGSIYGTKPVSIQVIDGATSLTTGDGKAYFRIPTALNGMDLISVAASVIAKSTSGTPTVQLARGRQANATSAHSFTDMLTTKVTIDANEFDSKDAAAAVAIDTANDDVLTGDLIRIDVDVAGTGTTGLFVTCAFRTP